MSDTSERTEQNPDWKASIGRTTLYEFVSAAGQIVDELRLHIDTGRVWYSAVDPANVAIVKGELSADAFDVYETDGAEIGLNVYRLRHVLERIEDQDTVSLTLRESNKRITVAAGPYSLTHRYISPDSIRSDADMPELDLTTTVDIRGEKMRAAVGLVDEVTDKANIGYESETDEFYVSGEGDIDDAEYRLHREDLEWVPESGDADSLFSVDYLKDVVEGVPEDTVVSVKVGNEFPYKMTFDIAQIDGPGNRYYGDVTYLQAPRIMSDGDDR